MPRLAIAIPADVRSAVFALLAQTGVGPAPSAQAFRRAVSVRKVRERLGGGNPATIGREINAVEAEIVQGGAEQVALPGIPADIAELMQQLWRAAVGVQLDEVTSLRTEAQTLAGASREQLIEAQLRAEVLKQELGELRSGLSDRDARLAQAVTDQAALAQQLQALRRALEDAQSREAQLVAERDTLHKAQAEAIAAAQERYEGMSRRLLEETAQQRQAAQAEVARMASQQKFADKRQAALETRLQHLEAELAQVQAQREQALGEASALRYVNTSQRTQIDEIVGLARGRQQPTKVTAAAAAKRVKSAVKGKGPST